MKIFGIGLSRTGTTSLNQALRMLGFKSIHFPDPLDIIASYDAATDTPVAESFRYLDEIYPCSKFILTERDDVETWLGSCECLWKDQFDKWPQNIHDLHMRLYKTVVFDRVRLREAYEKHAIDVSTYFSGRENDLLIMDVKIDPWNKLCGFLKLKVPNQPFPHRNTKEKIGDGWDQGTEPIF